jgi:hypothetical protein
MRFWCRRTKKIVNMNFRQRQKRSSGGSGQIWRVGIGSLGGEGHKWYPWKHTPHRRPHSNLPWLQILGVYYHAPTGDRHHKSNRATSNRRYSPIATPNPTSNTTAKKQGQSGHSPTKQATGQQQHSLTVMELTQAKLNSTSSLLIPITSVSLSSKTTGQSALKP